MNENKSINPIVAGVVVLILVIGGIWLWSQPSGSGAGVPETAAVPAAPGTAPTGSSTVQAPTPVTVMYTDQGFSPSNITVTQGSEVTFINRSTHNLWVASNPHPLHTGYDGTTLQQHCAAGAVPSFDECSAGVPGSSYTFLFGKPGTWGYHNHVLHSDTGTVVVVAR